MKNSIKKVFADRDIQQFIGKQLRWGVIISCSIALLGGLYYLFAHGAEQTPNYSRFSGEPSSYTSLKGIMEGVFALHARNIIQLGVVVLLATPILRVFFSLLAFIKEKDRMYIIITTIVLAIIIFSMTSGVKI